MGIMQQINELKANGEDFEFYPTTQRMIDTVATDIATKAYHTGRKSLTLLEIGAGDCRVNQSLKQHSGTNIQDLLVIEKAVTHIKKLPTDCVLVGTEFLETNLSSIEADVVFCNPPYSEFEFWASHIIKSCFASVVYLIIPSRWQDSKLIKQALFERDMSATVIAHDDFLSADRKARAVVDIIRITKTANILDPDMTDIQQEARAYYRDRLGKQFTIGKASDPIYEALSELNQADDTIEPTDPKAVFVSGGTLQDMVAFYQKDLQELNDSYMAISKMNLKFFKLVGVNQEAICKSIKEGIKQLKYNYWQAFFDCYEPITDRLTHTSRNKLYEAVLTHAHSIDFTLSNCYAMTVLAIERSNQYFDDQIAQLFYSHANPENLATYVSNQKVFNKSRYRYMTDNEKQANFERCKLEYRLVNNYSVSQWLISETHRNMQNVINRYCVIARSLNFGVNGTLVRLNDGSELTDNQYPQGQKIVIEYNQDGVTTTLFDIIFYKKGTYHIRLSQKFCLALNIAIAKLFGWVKTAAEASEQLSEKLSDVEAVFNTPTHLSIDTTHLPRLNFTA